MINLLPPQFKEELRQEKNWKVILILGMLFLIFLLFLILILFSIKIYIQGQTESQKILVNLEEKTAQTEKFRSLLEKMNSVNKNISKLSSFYQKETRPSEILEKVSQIVLPSMHLTAFSWQKANSQIALSGFFPTREIFLQFKKNLEEKKEFSKIYFSPQCWTKSINIDFNATFNYEPY